MKVSVLVITYNHERFITQALEGALAQRVNFDYEIVVGEDCSTDRTREIVMDFQRRYPDKIVPLLREHNIGGKENLLATLAACRGQYLALLEGDDYWISEDKLQKQVDFLDAHPDFAMCCSRAKVVYEDGGHASEIWPSRVAGAYGLEDLLTENLVVTCTAVYRRNLIDPLPGWFSTMVPGDWALAVLAARFGKINLLDGVMAGHVMHSRGLWSSRSEVGQLRALMRMMKTLDEHFEFQYTGTIRRTVARYHFRMAAIAREKGKRLETGKHVAGYLWNGGLSFPDSKLTLASVAAYVVFGSWYKALGKARRAILR